MKSGQNSFAEKHKALAYEIMASAASEVVMRNRGREYRDGMNECVFIEFPLKCKFAKDFPKGFMVSKTKTSQVRKLRATKLLDYIYKKGYYPYDSAMLVKQTKAYEYLDGEIDRMFNII